MKKTIALIALCAALGAQAFDIDSEALRIASQQPALQARKALADAEMEEYSASNVLEGPEAEFEYKFAPAGADNRWGFSIGQSFDFPGVYSARTKANRLRRGAFRELYRSDLMDMALEVKIAIIRLAQASETCKVVVEAFRTVDKLYGTYREALERGETTILEVRKIELRRFEMARQADEARSELTEAQIAMAVLCGGAGNAAAVTPDAIPVQELKPFEFYSSAMTEANPRLAYESGIADAENASVSVAKRSGLPSFRLAYVHDFEENTHFNGFGISISLPSWNNGRNVRAARARALAAEQTLADSRLRAQADLNAGYEAATRLYQNLALGRDVFDASEYPAYLSLALESGRINIFTYLTEYADYLDSRLEYIGLKGDYARAEANLSKYSVTIEQ